MGFRFKLVLADSLYGESGCGFINVLYELKLDVVAIRSNHAVWLPREQTVRCNRCASLSACSAMVKLSFVIFEKLFLASAALNNIGNWPPTQRRCQRMQLGVWWRTLRSSSMTKLAIYGLRNWVEWLEAEQERVGMGRFSRHELCSDWALVGDGDECVFGQSPHKHCISLNHNLRSNAMLNPKQSCSNSHNIRVGIRQTETGAQQFAFSDSALGDLEFASTLVESISDSTLISRIRVFSCTDESLPKSLALPRPTGRLPLFLCRWQKSDIAI